MFPRTDLALEQCKEHMAASGAVGSPVETYLIQHLLVLLCSEIQKCINDAVVERCAALSDLGVRNFSKWAADKLLRSVKKSEIAGFLAHFGEELKDNFNSEVTDDEVTQYGRAVMARHEIAHGAGPTTQWTLRDFEVALAEAHSLVNKAVHQLKATLPTTLV